MSRAPLRALRTDALAPIGASRQPWIPPFPRHTLESLIYAHADHHPAWTLILDPNCVILNTYDQSLECRPHVSAAASDAPYHHGVAIPRLRTGVLHNDQATKMLSRVHKA